MGMEKSSTMVVRGWMVRLAEKHNVSVELIQDFYYNMPHIHGVNQTVRTKKFFDAYFEGRNE